MKQPSKAMRLALVRAKSWEAFMPGTTRAQLLRRFQEKTQSMLTFEGNLLRDDDLGKSMSDAPHERRDAPLSRRASL
jgi:delta 1-pyrroline-5-carboxylate dehydrogenase